MAEWKSSRSIIDAEIKQTQRRYEAISQPHFALLDELEILNTRYRSMDNETIKEKLRIDEIIPKAQTLASISVMRNIHERAKKILSVMEAQ
jgi:hypothetical protein